MAKEHSPDQMAMGWFSITIVGAALFIGAVFVFVL